MILFKAHNSDLWFFATLSTAFVPRRSGGTFYRVTGTGASDQAASAAVDLSVGEGCSNSTGVFAGLYSKSVLNTRSEVSVWQGRAALPLLRQSDASEVKRGCSGRTAALAFTSGHLVQISPAASAGSYVLPPVGELSDPVLIFILVTSTC